MSAILCAVAAAIVAGFLTWVALRYARARRTRGDRARLRERLARELAEDWERNWAKEFDAGSFRFQGPDSKLVTPADVRASMEETLRGYENSDALLPMMDRVSVSYDAATKRMHAEIPTTWDVIAEMAWKRYEDGDRHDQVTAWLDADIRQGWREALDEVVFPDGSRRWMLRVYEVLVELRVGG